MDFHWRKQEKAHCHFCFLWSFSHHKILENLNCFPLSVWTLLRVMCGMVQFSAHKLFLSPHLHGSGQIFCTDKYLHGSTLCLHRIARTRQTFERPRSTFWKAGWLFNRHGTIFCTDSSKTVQHFAQIAQLRPGINSYFDWLLSKNETFCPCFVTFCFI